MAVFMFISLFVIAIYFKYEFHKIICDIQKLSIQSGTLIFGTNYDNNQKMSNDIHFLNKLWLGKLISEVPHSTLRRQLTHARKLFIYQLFFGFLGFASVLVNGLISA